MSPSIVIAVAPTGARRTKADHPALPITPDEVAADAARCLEAGASVLHLHVREDDGSHSLDPDRYRAALAAVRDRVGDRMLVQVTSEAVGRYDAAEQMAVVRSLRPEAVSLALREIVPEGGEAEAARFFRWLQDERVAPQFILYALEEVEWLLALRERGILPFERPHALFVLGRYAPGQRSSAADLLPFHAAWGDEAGPWSVCAFGPEEARCMALAVSLGGHARVGFENNLHRPDGSLAAANAELVADVAALARLLGRPPAGIGAARAVYGT